MLFSLYFLILYNLINIFGLMWVNILVIQYVSPCTIYVFDRMKICISIVSHMWSVSG
ncbi:hypothetical protein HanRHA438_Chr05g0239711 [Helianthus annuus]|nr:hypothetical protein HanRHA438_Chr05g0239711 [Helianthus annuus]